jgi:biotin carboxylase
MARVLLLMTTRSYRAWAFLQAARRLGVDVVVGSEQPAALPPPGQAATLTLDFGRPMRGLRRIVDYAQHHPLDAVVGVDDDTTLMAALAADALGLPHNSVESVLATRDKYRMRRLLAKAALPSPRFKRLSLAADPAPLAHRASYPCVLKPVSLSGSRGVIRADDPDAFVVAFRRIVAMLRADGAGHRHILLESFLPGPEVALEGLLSHGELRVRLVEHRQDP